MAKFKTPLPIQGFPGGSDGKEPACNAGDWGLIPGLGRSPGGGQGNPLQYSSPENPMDRGAWRAAVPGVAQSRTQLSDLVHGRCFSAGVLCLALSSLRVISTPDGPQYQVPH